MGNQQTQCCGLRKLEICGENREEGGTIRKDYVGGEGDDEDNGREDVVYYFRTGDQSSPEATAAAEQVTQKDQKQNRQEQRKQKNEIVKRHSDRILDNPPRGMLIQH